MRKANVCGLAAVVVIVCWMFVYGCGGGFVKGGADAAYASKEAYDVALSTMGSLYKQGLISEGVKDKAVEYGRLYKTAHNAMVESLAVYVESGKDGARSQYLNDAAAASRALATLLEYVKPFLRGD